MAPISPQGSSDIVCDAEVAAPWTEETIKQCLYLYLALLPHNHKLIHELASVYTEAIADIKRTVLRVIEQPVRLAADRGDIEGTWDSGWGGPVIPVVALL